jgi:hypothetical protein
MANTLDKGPTGSMLAEHHWESLLPRIRAGKCTPFLGAGINHGILPGGSDIAKELARKFDYPLKDRSDLARVTQFLAVTRDPMFPKDRILELLEEKLEKWQKTVTLPDFFRAPDEPLGVLADLPLPIYMTTNYDNLMVKALDARQKDPRRELCRWNKYVKEKPSVFDSASGFEPTSANPVVFHLHGHDEVPESLVLTEDDYLNFLVNISRQQDLLPPRIQEALAGTSLLFIGYRLADWDFRVLFRGLVDSMESSLRRISVAVQLPPEDLKQQEYLVDYFGNIKVEVYWGTAKEFAAELRDRWSEFAK